MDTIRTTVNLDTRQSAVALYVSLDNIQAAVTPATQQANSATRHSVAMDTIQTAVNRASTALHSVAMDTIQTTVNRATTTPQSIQTTLKPDTRQSAVTQCVSLDNIESAAIDTIQTMVNLDTRQSAVTQCVSLDDIQTEVVAATQANSATRHSAATQCTPLDIIQIAENLTIRHSAATQCTSLDTIQTAVNPAIRQATATQCTSMDTMLTVVNPATTQYISLETIPTAALALDQHAATTHRRSVSLHTSLQTPWMDVDTEIPASHKLNKLDYIIDSHKLKSPQVSTTPETAFTAAVSPESPKNEHKPDERVNTNILHDLNSCDDSSNHDQTTSGHHNAISLQIASQNVLVKASTASDVSLKLVASDNNDAHANSDEISNGQRKQLNSTKPNEHIQTTPAKSRTLETTSVSSIKSNISKSQLKTNPNIILHGSEAARTSKQIYAPGTPSRIEPSTEVDILTETVPVKSSVLQSTTPTNDIVTSNVVNNHKETHSTENDVSETTFGGSPDITISDVGQNSSHNSESNIIPESAFDAILDSTPSPASEAMPSTITSTNTTRSPAVNRISAVRSTGQVLPYVFFKSLVCCFAPHRATH